MIQQLYTSAELTEAYYQPAVWGWIETQPPEAAVARKGSLKLDKGPERQLTAEWMTIPVAEMNDVSSFIFPKFLSKHQFK